MNLNCIIYYSPHNLPANWVARFCRVLPHFTPDNDLTAKVASELGSGVLPHFAPPRVKMAHNIDCERVVHIVLDFYPIFPRHPIGLRNWWSKVLPHFPHHPLEDEMVLGFELRFELRFGWRGFTPFYPAHETMSS